MSVSYTHLDVYKRQALTLQKKQIEEQEKAMRVQLMAAMEKYGVKSFENKDVKFTLSLIHI